VRVARITSNDPGRDRLSFRLVPGCSGAVGVVVGRLTQTPIRLRWRLAVASTGNPLCRTQTPACNTRAMSQMRIVYGHVFCDGTPYETAISGFAARSRIATQLARYGFRV
jgi:hypothetical protein